MKEISKQKKEERAARAEARKRFKMQIVGGKRANGSRRIAFDYSECPSKVDPTGAKDTDLNYLVAKYTPNELANYIAARNMNRKPIEGHDFSQEPNLQEAKNEVLRLKYAFNDLKEDVKKQFRDVTEFLKFIDNPKNVDLMVKYGLLTKKEVEQFVEPTPTPTPPPTTPEEKK